MVEKDFRLRVIIGMVLEERGIKADAVTAAELLRAELLADAFIARLAPGQKPSERSESLLLKPS